MNVLDFIKKFNTIEDKLNNEFIETILNILIGKEKIISIIKTDIQNTIQVAENATENTVQYVIPTNDGSVIFTTKGYLFLDEIYITEMIDDCAYGFSPKTAFLQAILKELIICNGFKLPDELPDEDEALIKNILHLIG